MRCIKLYRNARYCKVLHLQLGYIGIDNMYITLSYITIDNVQCIDLCITIDNAYCIEADCGDAQQESSSTLPAWEMLIGATSNCH